MPPGNPTRLLKLADREFRQLTEDRTAAPPAPRRFKPVRLNVTRFDQSWDRKRGSAARLMAVLLREDDSALHQRVCESERAAKTYADAADWPAAGVSLSAQSVAAPGHRCGTGRGCARALRGESGASAIAIGAMGRRSVSGRLSR